MKPARNAGPARQPRRRKGLLLVPEFPYDSFWSYRYIIRLVGRRAAFPPLGLLTFAGYLADWDLELVDLNVRVPSARRLRAKMAAADAVFVSAMSIQKRSLVDLLTGPASGLDTPFVLGGPFASSFRSEILQPANDSDQVLHDGLDVLVWGEAGASIDALLEHLETEPEHSAGSPRLLIPHAVDEAPCGSREYLNDRSLFRPLDDVPLPRWDLIDVHDYESMMIQTTAGCPFRCEFCDIIQFNGGFNRPKSPAVVRRELEAILATGYRGGVFSVDDNFIGMPDAISDVLDAMTEFQRENDYPFVFLTQASVNLGTPKLEHLIGKMKVAGFNAVFLGIETPDEDALRRMNKKQNLKVDVPALVARMQSEGIEVYAGFIFGNDGDTPSTADRIIEFIRRTRIFTAMTGILTPVPHTPLYARLEREGRLRPAEYSGNNTDDEIQFEPSDMTVTELRQGIHRILTGLFSPGESYRRGLDMLRVIRPHIFADRQLDLGYLRGAVVSFWRQGVRRLDPRYFGLLWQAFRLDHQLYRSARREARRLGRAVRRIGRQPVPELWPSRERLDELVGFAQDYLVRFRPDARLDQVKAWGADVRDRVRDGAPSAEDVRAVYANARNYLKVLMRSHRFPGVKFAGAIELAIKEMHYERVMRAIVAPPPQQLATESGTEISHDRPEG
ncbi:MAG: DUF4070 domain-containing protein [Gemmatimonadota bacterium]